MIHKIYIVRILIISLLFQGAMPSLLAEDQDNPAELLELRRIYQEREQEKVQKDTELRQLEKDKKRLLLASNQMSKLETLLSSTQKKFTKSYETIAQDFEQIKDLAQEDQKEAQELATWIASAYQGLINSDNRSELSNSLDREHDQLLRNNLVCRVSRAASKSNDILKMVDGLRAYLEPLHQAIENSRKYEELEEQSKFAMQAYIDFTAAFANLFEQGQSSLRQYEKHPEICNTFVSFKKIKSFIMVQMQVNGDLQTLKDIDISSVFNEIESREKALLLIKNQRRAILNIGYDLVKYLDNANNLNAIITYYRDAISSINTLAQKVKVSKHIEKSEVSSFYDRVAEVKSDINGQMDSLFNGSRAYNLVRPQYSKLLLSIRKTMMRNPELTQSPAWGRIVANAEKELGLSTTTYVPLAKDQSLSFYLNAETWITSLTRDLEELHKL